MKRNNYLTGYEVLAIIAPKTAEDSWWRNDIMYMFFPDYDTEIQYTSALALIDWDMLWDACRDQRGVFPSDSVLSHRLPPFEVNIRMSGDNDSKVKEGDFLYQNLDDAISEKNKFIEKHQSEGDGQRVIWKIYKVDLFEELPEDGFGWPTQSEERVLVEQSDFIDSVEYHQLVHSFNVDVNGGKHPKIKEFVRKLCTQVFEESFKPVVDAHVRQRLLANVLCRTAFEQAGVSKDKFPESKQTAGISGFLPNLDDWLDALECEKWTRDLTYAFLNSPKYSSAQAYALEILGTCQESDRVEYELSEDVFSPDKLGRIAALHALILNKTVDEDYVLDFMRSLIKTGQANAPVYHRWLDSDTLFFSLYSPINSQECIRE